MILKKTLLAAGTALSILLGSGCVVVKEYTPEEEKITVSKQEYDLAAKLLRAFVKNDAKGFIALLPEETRSKFTEKHFSATRKSVIESVGEPIGFMYMTTLKLETLHPQIWKVIFKRSNVNNTREYTSEVLFKVVTGMTGKKEAVITGFHFL